MPATTPGVVQRRALVARLAATPDAGVALLVAPAGYGKTTLLKEWAQNDPRPFAWLRLTPDLDDGGELRAAVAAALDATPDPEVLVLDDGHHLRSDDALAVLHRLIDDLAPDVRLALASRRRLPLPLGRLRTERRLLELTAADLVLTRVEVAQVAAANGLALDESGEELLAQRTEGWPAGVYLAALALRDETSPRRALDRFGGNDRFMVDYIGDELLSELDPDWIEFLTSSSVMTRLSGPMCDYVLERNDSARLLRELSHMNVLVVPLDRTDTVYRYHWLFADALRAELRLSRPELERALHGRASNWFASHGERGLAIEHAVQAGDIAGAGGLLWDDAFALLGQGRTELSLRRVALFSPDQLAASAPLALSAACAHLGCGDRALAEHWTATAEGVLQVDASATAGDSLGAGLHALRSTATDDVEVMRAEAAQAYDLAADDSPWRSLACLMEGTALKLGGSDAAARARLEEGSRRGAAVGPAVQILCLAELASLAIDQDDWHGAGTLTALARAQVDRVGLADWPMAALVFAVSAAVHAHGKRPDTAEREARQADRLLEGLTGFMPWYIVQCLTALAWASLRMNELDRTRDLLATADRSLRALTGATAARSSLDACRAQSEAASAARTGDSEPLTTAELRVLLYLPTHLSFPEIADQLYVSRNTVKTHVRAVYRKLAASSRSEAVRHAREAGLISRESDEAGAPGAA